MERLKIRKNIDNEYMSNLMLEKSKPLDTIDKNIIEDELKRIADEQKRDITNKNALLEQIKRL